MTKEKALRVLAIFDRKIAEISNKIINNSGWWTESHIIRFKKERWEIKKNKDKFYQEVVHYLL